MTGDARSRKLVVISHCLLNQNAKVEPLATHAGAFEPVARLLLDAGAGMVQLPCPEALHYGVDRPLGSDTRDQYDSPAYRTTCRQLAAQASALLRAYRDADYRVACILGVEGSPSCSVSTVPVLGPGGERTTVPGCGLFIEALRQAMDGIDIPFIGVPEVQEAGDLEAALSSLRDALL